MIFQDRLYHVFNQGNRKQPLFLEHEDYLTFLIKFRYFVLNNGNALAYCLMPNHFHFLIDTNERSAEKVKIGNIELSRLTNGFRLLQSEYAQYFNKKYEKTGSLFRQKAKYKDLETSDYAFVCFHYIHQNPLKAKLISSLEEWEYSSFRDYAQLRKGKIPSIELAEKLLGISLDTFVKDSYQVISPEILRKFGLD